MPKKTDLLSALMANDRSAKTFLRRQRQHEELEHERELAEIRAGSPRSVFPVTGNERPPLHPIIKESIDQLWHRLDQTHWPNITAMRVKKYYPPDTPVPPPAPETLLGQIRGYANMLFKVEADQYGEFRNHEQYQRWLAHLAERVVLKVMTALERLDEGDPDALLLSYHGLSKSDVEEQMREAMFAMASAYAPGVSGFVKAPARPPLPLERDPIQVADLSKVQRRAKLLEEYKAATNNTSNKRIYEAKNSGVHKPEFYRWINGELPSGSSTAMNFERFLQAKRPPIPRRPKA
jgi:hypothetical protein